jgi:type III secretory pathway component EscR
MKVNKIIALRLMLSVTMIMVLPVAVKIKFKFVRATGWNVEEKSL